MNDSSEGAGVREVHLVEKYLMVVVGERLRAAPTPTTYSRKEVTVWSGRRAAPPPTDQT